MKDLEQQLSEYKTMVAELTIDNRALKNFIEKKPSAKPNHEPLLKMSAAALGYPSLTYIYAPFLIRKSIIISVAFFESIFEVSKLNSG
jgi:hypothetical protein